MHADFADTRADKADENGAERRRSGERRKSNPHPNYDRRQNNSPLYTGSERRRSEDRRCVEDRRKEINASGSDPSENKCNIKN